LKRIKHEEISEDRIFETAFLYSQILAKAKIEKG